MDNHKNKTWRPTCAEGTSSQGGWRFLFNDLIVRPAPARRLPPQKRRCGWARGLQKFPVKHGVCRPGAPIGHFFPPAANFNSRDPWPR